MRFRNPALLALLATVAPARPNHGSVTCERCERLVPALTAQGSYTCTCGHAVYVDPGPLALEPEP